jgi:hypothetical protein
MCALYSFFFSYFLFPPTLKCWLCVDQFFNRTQQHQHMLCDDTQAYLNHLLKKYSTNKLELVWSK